VAEVKNSMVASYRGELLLCIKCVEFCDHIRKRTPWPESVSELYRPSDRGLSAKLVPTFADRGCYVVSEAEPHVHILDFQTGAATIPSK
jgi:hypothetical protein